MRKKVISIFLVTLMVLSIVQIVNLSEPNKAATGPSLNNQGLDYRFFKNITTTLSNVVHTSYGPTQVKKGRYFGSQGNRDAATILLDGFKNDSGFENAQKIRIFDDAENGYADYVDVSTYNLTINSDDFTTNTSPHCPYNTIPIDDYYPLPAMWDPNNDLNKTTDFSGSTIIEEYDRQQTYPKMDYGIEPYNLSYTLLNEENYPIMGNVTYVSEGKTIPTHDTKTLFLLDDTQGVENQIENATDSAGILLMKNTSTLGFQNDKTTLSLSHESIHKSKTMQRILRT